MALVKTKPKKERKPSGYQGLRMPIELQNRIDDTFNQVLTVQPELKKAELIRDAIERGLTEIEQQLEEAKK
jgi:predicted DNA-binding protein